MSISSGEPLSISQGHIHIWSISAIDDIHKLNEISKILSKDELLKASKFRFNKDRSVYITARFLLRKLIGSYLGIAPKEIVFEYSEFGKPSYLKNVDLDFNVSHSGNRIIIGFSKEYNLGVDIERIKKDFDPLELAENVFSDDEIRALSATNDSEKFQAFYRGWTRKESFIKAVGEGLSYPLKSFTVTIDDDENASFITINSTQESQQNWQLHSFIPAKDFIAAITTNGKPVHIEFFDAKNQFI
ncbi:4'-phosphopantetheinyl transferase superfamily protein [Aurantibacter crassamenti]|uniref:4'-phosphopantetheinyl transferase family protein n=1 Tax=Aurantibacter crassamenti TaxID=1837375 RepID=UPI00193950F1|nr:4'-phosphopantetheinyl transferase superfamily protein [Aurantibacter crassamenti]MBM1106812.1 4'-phosphopantetheinyl transferase superfamily protein [Aurantibacter crassamenti]